MDHLLLHCKVASVIWSAFFSRFGLSWVMSRHVDLYDCLWSSGKPRSASVWKMVPMCLFWCLWREMNDKNFEDRERTLEEILSLFFETLYLWTPSFVFSLSLSYSDFSCSFCSL